MRISIERLNKYSEVNSIIFTHASDNQLNGNGICVETREIWKPKNRDSFIYITYVCMRCKFFNIHISTKETLYIIDVVCEIMLINVKEIKKKNTFFSSSFHSEREIWENGKKQQSHSINRSWKHYQCSVSLIELLFVLSWTILNFNSSSLLSRKTFIHCMWLKPFQRLSYTMHNWNNVSVSVNANEKAIILDCSLRIRKSKFEKSFTWALVW